MFIIKMTAVVVPCADAGVNAVNNVRLENLNVLPNVNDITLNSGT